MINIPSSPILLPIIDHNINSFLKNQNNKFINIPSKYENEEENGLKLEEIFDRNNAYIFENLFKFYTIEINNIVNNINLEEAKDPKISQDGLNNSLNNDIVIVIDSLSEEDKQINTKKIFLTVYPKKISLFTKAKTQINFSPEKNLMMN